MEPEDRQVMPGVTLTDFRKQSSTASQTTVAGDQVEVVQAQIKELRNQIKHLVRSNAELAEALAEEYDKDFADAIEGTLLTSFKLSIEICLILRSIVQKTRVSS
jgi:predicted transcriptional regulator